MKAEIIAIIDRSGSMERLVADTIGGFNRFLADQQALPGEAKFSLVLFDHEILRPCSGVPIAQVKPLDGQSYVVRGTTALLDAIGTTLNQEGARIKAEGWADKVIVCIITDGYENASKEFKAEQIKKMIEHAQGHDWHFVFLAANQDAFSTGAKYGINAQHTQSFAATGQGVTAAYAHSTRAVTNLRADPDPTAPNYLIDQGD